MKDEIAELLTAKQIARAYYVPRVTLHLAKEGILSDERARIHSPADAYELCKAYFAPLAKEHMVVLCLNTKNRVLCMETVYVGSVHTSVVRLAELFVPANLCYASGIIVLHNHPSGDATPSPEDAAITREMVRAGCILDIDVLDHLVIGENRFVSLKEQGLGFN